MLNISLNELKLIARSRHIKNYKSMSKKRLLSALNESKSAESEKNLHNTRIKQIRERFNKLRDRFLKPKIKEIRRNLYEIENKKNLFESKMKEIEKNLLELEESLSKLKKYYDYDDIESKGIREVQGKGTEKCVIRRILKFNDYEDGLFNKKIILKSQQRFKSDYHNIYTEQINNIALSSNDDKRLQTFDEITTYPYGTNAFKVCESEMVSNYK